MRIFQLFVATGVFLAAVGAASVPARAEEGTRFAIVNLQKIIVESKKGQKAKKEYDQELVKRKNALQKLQDEVQSLQQELESQGTLLSEDMAEQKREEVRRKIKDAQRRAADYDEEIKRLDKRLTDNILDDVRAVVKDYAQKNNLQIVLEGTSVMTLYVDEGLDITKKVMDLYDSKPAKK